MARNPTLSEAARLFDDLCLKILKDGGIRVLVEDGDGKSHVETITPPAPIMAVIERRLHHTGHSLTKPSELAEGMNSYERLQRIRLARDGKMPPLPEGNDDAARQVG